MKGLRGFLLCLLLCLTANLGAQVWEGDYAKAQLRAEAEHKNLLVVFTGSDWCKSCMKWEAAVLSTAELDTLAGAEYVFYRADFPRSRKHQPPQERKLINDGLAAAYNQGGVFPCAVLLSDDHHRVIGRLEYAEENAAGFVKRLEALRVPATPAP